MREREKAYEHVAYVNRLGGGRVGQQGQARDVDCDGAPLHVCQHYQHRASQERARMLRRHQREHLVLRHTILCCVVLRCVMLCCVVCVERHCIAFALH